jgi:hypothetical protein
LYGLWAAIPPFVAKENLVTTFEIFVYLLFYFFSFFLASSASASAIY